MSKKSDKEKSRELTVVVKNLDGKILTDEDLRNTVITNEMYYVYVNEIRERINDNFILETDHKINTI